MSENDLGKFFEDAFRVLKKEVKVKEFVFTSGGCINNAARITTNSGAFFIKWNNAENGKLFVAEAKGLQLLSKVKIIKVPEVIGYGELDNKIFLILEFIKNSIPQNHFWEDFGRLLSELHRSSNPLYGLEDDNFIGPLHQINSFKSSWVQFFIENRLDRQIDLAYNNGYVSESFLKKFKNIYIKLPDLLPEEKPALLHGDLWSGNFLVQANGRPCLIDPAVYYGNREIEMAFTKLFGGFDPLFYKAYQESFPMLPGFEKRVDIYNLYYLLVHVNLFGTSYLGPVERTVKVLQ